MWGRLFHFFYSSELSQYSFIFESFHWFKANIFVNVSKLSWSSVSKHPSWFVLWFLIFTVNTKHLALLHHPHLLCVSIVTNIHIMATTSDPVTLICSLQCKSVPSLSLHIFGLWAPGLQYSLMDIFNLVCAQCLDLYSGSLGLCVSTCISAKYYELYDTYESQQFQVEMNTRGSKTCIHFHINNDLQGQSLY